MERNDRVRRGRDFIEELVFSVDPDWLERFIEAEASLLAGPLSQRKGFVEWQIEIDENDPVDVRSIYYWESEDDYRQLDQVWLGERKKAIAEALPADNVRFVAARHAEKRRFRVCRLSAASEISEEENER